MNHHKLNLGDVIGETVSTTAILCHEYYTHPESDKNIPSPQFMFSCYNLFNKYLSKQLELIKTVDDVKKHAKNFVQIVVEEGKKAEAAKAQAEEKKNESESSAN